jgi:hypothetical protein
VLLLELPPAPPCTTAPAAVAGWGVGVSLAALPQSTNTHLAVASSAAVGVRHPGPCCKPSL